MIANPVEPECTALKEIEKNSIFSVNTNSYNRFKQLQELAEYLSKSDLVPQSYKGKPSNCLIAMDIANQVNMPPFMVMQNLFVIQGKPSWSGQMINALIRTRYTDIEVQHFHKEENGPDAKGCRIKAVDPKGKTVYGPVVTIAMAKKEGWYEKNGSKWPSIPDLMLTYRAFTFFGRVHCPDLLLGMQSKEEHQDIDSEVDPVDAAQALTEALVANGQEAEEEIIDAEATETIPEPEVEAKEQAEAEEQKRIAEELAAKQQAEKPPEPVAEGPPEPPAEKPTGRDYKYFEKQINDLTSVDGCQVLREEIEESKVTAGNKQKLLDKLADVEDMFFKREDELMAQQQHLDGLSNNTQHL